jgi:hypothetical protein
MSTIEPEVMEGGRRIEGNSICERMSKVTIKVPPQSRVDIFENDFVLLGNKR